MKTYTEGQIRERALSKESILQEIQRLGSEKLTLEEQEVEKRRSLKEASSITTLYQARLYCLSLPAAIEMASKNMAEQQALLRKLTDDLEPYHQDIQRLGASIVDYQQRIAALNKLMRDERALAQQIVKYEIQERQERRRLAEINAERCYHPHYHGHFYSPVRPIVYVNDWALERERSALNASSTFATLSRLELRRGLLQSQIRAESSLGTLQGRLVEALTAVEPLCRKKLAQQQQSERVHQLTEAHEVLIRKWQDAQALVVSSPPCSMGQDDLEKALDEAKGSQDEHQVALDRVLVAIASNKEATLAQERRLNIENSHSFVRSFIEDPENLYAQVLQNTEQALATYEKKHPYHQGPGTRQILVNFSAKLSDARAMVQEHDTPRVAQDRVKLLYGLIWAMIEMAKTYPRDAEALHDALWTSLGGAAFEKEEAWSYYTSHSDRLPTTYAWSDIVSGERAQYQSAHDSFQSYLLTQAPAGQDAFYAQGRRLLKAVEQKCLMAPAETFDYKYYAKVLSCAQSYLLYPAHPESLEAFKTVIEANTDDNRHTASYVTGCALAFLGAGFMVAGFSLLLSAAIAPPLLVVGLALIIGGVILALRNDEKAAVREGHGFIKEAKNLHFFPAPSAPALLVPPGNERSLPFS